MNINSCHRERRHKRLQENLLEEKLFIEEFPQHNHPHLSYHKLHKNLEELLENHSKKFEKFLYRKKLRKKLFKKKLVRKKQLKK